MDHVPLLSKDLSQNRLKGRALRVRVESEGGLGFKYIS